MSETDDTDVLLLIPPTFFLVNSSGSEDSLLKSSRTVVHKPVSCTAKVIGKLVDQVQSLESRLETLEIDTSNTFSSLGSRRVWDTESFESRSLDRRCFTFPRRRHRKARRERSRNVSQLSLDSANEKKTVYKQIIDCKSVTLSLNESQSMDGDLSSIMSTPSKKNDKLLLHEIDDFLTKVESYETPESKAKESEISPQHVIHATGEYIMNSLDGRNTEVQLPSGRIVPSNVLDKYIYLVKNKHSNTSTSTSARNECDGQNHTSASVSNECKVQNYTSASTRNEYNAQNCAPINNKQDAKSPSIRKLNFSESKDVQPTSTPKRNTHPKYSDSFKPSSNKILDRASKVLDNYRSQNYSRNTQSAMTEASDVSLKREDFKLPQMRPFCLDNRDGFKLDSMDTDLLSLSELWGERGEKSDKIDSNKLEEERLKREHCEVMIQQLQRKSLEQQEKLAVAIKVDRAKDAAINKLREAWLRLTGSLDRAEERHRTALDKMLREVDNFKMVADEAQKKTNHFETELYKALDLAHDYQEQCKLLTTEKRDLQEKMEKMQLDNLEANKLRDNEIVALKDNYETVMRLNKQCTDCVRNLEDALAKEKTEHEVTKGRTTELLSEIERLEQVRVSLEQERNTLQDKLREERGRCETLETQLGAARNQTSELVKKCEDLEAEVKSAQGQLERQRTELRGHYQAQLEAAVLEKLREFQQQLELAERQLETAAREAQRDAQHHADRRASALHQQHKLEVNLLEEKHKEEMKLHRLQLAQASEKIGLLESKLSSYRRGRGELAAQLHAVMQAQWKQALTILTAQHRPDSHADTASQPPYRSTPPTGLPPAARQHQRLRHTAIRSTAANETPSRDPEPDKPEEPTCERRDRGRSLHKPPWKA